VCSSDLDIFENKKENVIKIAVRVAESL